VEVIDKTIIYTTDHSLDPFLFGVCRRWLMKNSCGCPVISATMRPDDFGENVCVGVMPRSGISLDIQLLAAAKRVKTKWVMLAEHDCLYTEEHIRYIPPDDENFHYNDNAWLLQYDNPLYPEWNGVFSYRKGRRVQSQLVCDAKRYLEAMTAKVAIVTTPEWIKQYPSGRVAEPGCCDYDKTMLITRRETVKHLRPVLKEYMEKYQCVDFKTKLPNIDIRHGNNFTGQRRGNKRITPLPRSATREHSLQG
jgi:hypothetical protein